MSVSDAAPTGDDVLAALRAHKAVLVERFGVAGLALFGSFARGEAGADSDIDILVRFDGPASRKAISARSSTSKTCWAARWIRSPTKRRAPNSAPVSNGRRSMPDKGFGLSGMRWADAH